MDLKTKNKIKNIVTLYMEIYPQEYSQFLKSMKQKQATSNDYGDTKMDTIEKLVYEIPETLFGLLTIKLDEDETEKLNSPKGAEWFAKTFPQFSMISKFNKYA